ncbi:MAG: hypothetical protein IH849_07845 [Acidobacteria bacterium]|nr:hypothetical protein [Acidobacteriota bacterium]
METLHKMFADTVANLAFVGFLVFVMLVLTGAPEPAFAAQDPILTIPRTPLPQRTWVDVDGVPLPFYNEDQVMEFLRTAEIVERKSLAVGVTDPIKMKLRKDGIEVHAIFRYVDTVYPSVRMDDGRLRVNLKDSCHFEPAAYELSKLLRMDSVPPVVGRRIGNEMGSLQIWVYNAVMEDERVEQGMSAPNRIAWNQQVQLMYMFDALIGNDDRTAQNILIDKNFKVWLIDHTRAFYGRAEALSLDKVIYVERGFWEALQELDTESLNEAVGEFLTDTEIKQLLERRDRVVAHVSELIETRGEGAVLYEWAPSGR